MPDKWLVASGNTSNPANWNGGTLPTSADDCYADGFTGVIDAALTVLSLRTTARSGGTAGGGFTWNSSIVPTIAANIIAGSTTVVTQTGGTWTIVGSVTGSASVTSPAVSYSSAGLITGNITQGAGGGPAVQTSTIGVALSVSGNLSAANAVSSFGLPGCCVRTRGNVTVTGNVSCTAASAGCAIHVSDSGATVSITINGTTTSSAVPAICVTGTTTLTTLQLNGDVVGVIPISGTTHPIRITAHSTTPIAYQLPTWNVVSTRTLYSGGTNVGQPAIANVRQGTVFGAANEYTGTLIVPNPAYVSLGVPTDNTVGTLSIDLSSVLNRLPASLEGGRMQAVLSSTVLTQLFADADVTDLVNQIAAKFDAVDDLPIATIATAVRDALLNRILAGNHDTDGTPGKILQTVLTQTTSAASSAATAATQSTAANTNAAAAKVAAESADNKLSTGRLALIDGSAQKGTGTNTLSTIADLINNLETGGLTPPQAETLDSIAVALAGMSPVVPTGTTVFEHLNLIQSNTSSLSNLTASLPLSPGVIVGPSEPLVIGDDYTSAVGRQVRVNLLNSTGGSATTTFGSKSLSDAGISIQLLLRKSGQVSAAAQLVGTCTFTAAETVDGVEIPPYLLVSFSRTETAKATPGAYDMQAEAVWSSEEVVTFAPYGQVEFVRNIQRVG